ncbi:MAG: PDZ domain-containing protein [Candidatus Acidiferrales bacterium]
MLRKARAAIVAALLALGILAMGTSARAAGDALRYELKFEAPSTHLMDITIHASGLDGKSADFAIPAWAPGSYQIENYWMYVQGFHALGPDRQSLAWRKTDEETWRIDLNRATSVTVEYELYANTLANNEAQYNEKHAFIGGPAVWMYLVGGKERPIELSIAVPSGWKVATGLSRDAAGSFRAADYDWLADSPLEISDFKEQTFEFAGTKYHVIDHDIIGQKDFTKFTGDTEKIVQQLVPIFADVAGTSGQQAPFKEYWFLFHIWPKSGGGLEHLNSTQINFSTDWDSTTMAGTFRTQSELKLFVTSHEFFHAWNVKRIRPRPLGPFDYSRQVHTPSLWISEGLTSYYGALGVERAGLVTPQQYLDGIARLITKFEQEPGRKERSIEDTSWDTWWVRDTKLDNNAPNVQYSYYDGGQILGHLLDFAIRQNTQNKKSLDDWMRLMYQRYALPKPGFDPQDAIRALSEVAGMDLSDFSARYISGKEPLPYEQYFAYAGIEVEKKIDETKPWAGMEVKKGDDDQGPKIADIIPGSPAEASGLEKDDVVVAVDGRAVMTDDVAAIVGTHKPGDAVQFAMLRLGELREFNVTLRGNPYPTYTLKPIEHPTELQAEIYKSWLGR